MYNRILLPIDGSDHSKLATKHAIDIADRNNGHITVLFVIEPNYPSLPVLPIATLPTPDDNYYDELREEGNKIIEEFEVEIEKNQLGGKCQNINFNTLIREGKPHIEILETMKEEDFDLLVMGASGRNSTIDRLALGSVTEMVIRESKIPVMVIP
ncbi:universal stress protein [Methanobacterium sp.]|uniref:universal stress protein n=1 Tax=Methanobacterium sp. TaxID=2164 RepID=UPI003C71644E